MKSNNHFPIRRSILAAEALAQILASAYGLSLTRIQLIKAVILDTYHVVTTDGPYILRVYPHRRRTLAEISAELDFLTYLHANGAPVSVPVPQKDGERIVTINAPEGTRYAVLFTCARGQSLSQQLGPKSAYTYGHALARIHAIADTMPHALARSPLDLQMLLDRPLAYLEAFGQRQHDWAFLRAVADLIRPRIMALPTHPPQYGFCHGDTSASNVHMDDDGQLTFFDFDFCGPGWRAYDLGDFLIGESDAITQAFLDGYQSVRALDRQELDSIPPFQIAQSIWLLGMRASYINEWGSIHFTDAFIDRVLSFIRKTMPSESPVN